MDLKKKLEKLLADAQQAIDDGDAEAAEKHTAEATKVKALIGSQEQVAAMRAAQEDTAAEQEKKAAQEAEAALDAKVKAAVAEATKGLGIERPDYTGSGVEMEQLVSQRSAWDDLDVHQHALGYMVLKQAMRLGFRGPSQDYVRSLHGKAQKFVAKGGLKTIGYHDDGARATKSLHGLEQPTFYHHQADDIIRKSLAVKADELMGSDVSTYGDEWIPVFYSRELFRLIRNEARVASLFRQVEVAGESLVFPIQSGGVTWYKTPQTDDAAELIYSASFITSRTSQVSTGNMTLTPGKLSAIVIWTGELNEQSLVPMLPFLQQEMVMSGQHTLDELIISGDETTGATNISDYGNGSISAYWRLLILDGLRHHAIVDGSGANARDGGALTAEDFIATKKLMGTNGKNAIDPNSVAWVMDLGLYYKMLSLGEVLTRDKFGESTATIKSGQIERIFGSVVVPSEDYGATDSSGYIHNTSSGNTLGSFMCVRPDQGVIGFGRRMVIETDRIARSDAYEIVAHMSVDFDLTSYEAVGLSYNITV